MRRFLPFVLAAVAVAVPHVSAQRISESVEVTVIEVPVTVSDKTGASVRGLTAQNFEVLVDGKRTPIEYFETVDLTTVTGAQQQPQAQPLPAAAYRNFLLLFDLANSSPNSIGRAQQAARTFVETQLGERDLAAVATMTAEQGLQMVTSFTKDKEFLLASVATLGEAKFNKPADPLFLVRSSPTPLAQPKEGPAGGAGDKEAAANREIAEFNARSGMEHDSEMRGRLRAQLKNFGGVARALDRLRGQKQIILLSEGFDAKLLTGRDDLSFKNTQLENEAVEYGEIWNVDSDKRFGSASETKDMQEMVDLFRRSDVRLHAIDIKGLRSDVDAREGLKKSSNEGLFLLSRPTGGTVFRNDNNLSSQFSQLLKRQEVIYLLGFKAKEAKAGSFHPIKVKLVGAKGEVSHRSGYYDTPTNMNNLEATLKFSEMLATNTEIRDLPLHVVATPVPGSEGKARVPVVVDAAGEQFLQGVTGNGASANIFVYAFDQSGQAVDFLQQRLTLDVAKTSAAVKATGVRYVGSMRLAPGQYAIKALVRVNETGRIGLSTAEISVPEFGASAVLPPVAVRDMGSWVTLVSPTRGADATSILTLGDRPFVPGAQLEARSGGEHEVALMMRGLSMQNLGITPALVSADGTEKPAGVQLAGRTAPDEQGLTKLLFRFKPDVPPGRYALRFTVTPAGGTSSVVSLPVVIQ